MGPQDRVQAVKLLPSVLLCLQEGKNWEKDTRANSVVAVEALKSADKIRPSFAQIHLSVFDSISMQMRNRNVNMATKQALHRKLSGITASRPFWEKGYTFDPTVQARQCDPRLRCSRSHQYPYLPQRHVASEISADVSLHENARASMRGVMKQADDVLGP